MQHTVPTAKLTFRMANVKFKYTNRKSIFEFIFDGSSYVCQVLKMFTVQMWVTLTMDVRMGEGKMKENMLIESLHMIF